MYNPCRLVVTKQVQWAQDSEIGQVFIFKVGGMLQNITEEKFILHLCGSLFFFVSLCFLMPCCQKYNSDKPTDICFWKRRLFSLVTAQISLRCLFTSGNCTKHYTLISLWLQVMHNGFISWLHLVSCYSWRLGARGPPEGSPAEPFPNSALSSVVPALKFLLSAKTWQQTLLCVCACVYFLDIMITHHWTIWLLCGMT